MISEDLATQVLQKRIGLLYDAGEIRFFEHWPKREAKAAGPRVYFQESVSEGTYEWDEDGNASNAQQVPNSR